MGQKLENMYSTNQKCPFFHTFLHNVSQKGKITFLAPNQTMVDCRLQSRRWDTPRNMGPTATAGPVPLTKPQCCTYWPGVNCVQANFCPCRSANIPCTSGCPLENFRNQGPSRAPTAPSLTTNVSDVIEEAQESGLIICQSIDSFVFHQDASEFSPSVLPRGDDWTALPTHTDTDHTTPALTETVDPKPAEPAAVRSGKINLNRARPMDGQTASPSPPVNQYSDVTSVASTG